jgi:hypothetical protein
MRKISLFLSLFILLTFSSVALANVNGMMGFCGSCGTMPGGWFWAAGLLSLVYFALVSLIFSIIFWLVYKWLIKK